LSNDDSLDWEAKKQKYIETVEAGGKKVMTVSLADKIVNMRSLLEIYRKDGEAIWERFNRGKAAKLWFENSVLEMLQKNLDHPLVEVYAGLINELEARCEVN